MKRRLAVSISIPIEGVRMMDLGFTGFEKDYPDTLVMMPKKKPKRKELTDDARARNWVVSGFRVLVEHAIGGVKRFGTVSDKFRNRKDEFDDKVMLGHNRNIQ